MEEEDESPRTDIRIPKLSKGVAVLAFLAAVGVMTTITAAAYVVFTLVRLVF